ncbi:RelA/SpoT domain-containing protein [Sphingomonas immobilis]|uniref:RelA/SpoT domain-containing protein n=1 Tax=Sphingomonas immobilis TaxID=3063997 RepID=A0ABT9A1D3_9SPHN|nr:RelA/SpoT domain-containing protein [Sphingomonas sp. CA1-15]MDO7843272.1 RelA/SpoT domain-containing protein [Sphingomonas sp. CA1-15]
MVSWVSPKFSKNRVNRAGRAIGEGNPTPEDIEVMENWRASHAYVLNTFQATLRNRSRETTAVVGTRLKRRATIENKVRRFPDMQLARMHDIAGCRIIFDTVEQLLAFRNDLHHARFNHRRRGADNEERWNYLVNPKPDGCRGIHEVYEYDVRSEGGKTWNGLNVEIQFRTFAQHAWSTAVEVAGLLTLNKPKFGQGSPELIEQFQLASELIARYFEGSTSCFPSLSIAELKDRFNKCEFQTRIIELFRRVNTKVVDIDFRKNNVLVFPYVKVEDENMSDLEVYSFDNVFRAIERYNALEERMSNTADVVLVRADSFDNMRVTFRNYFADTTDFVDMVNKALEA